MRLRSSFFFLNLTNKLALILVITGVLMLSLGGHFLVKGASNLALNLGISEAAIAVTIVAIGGSAPELATSVIAAYRKHSDLAIGNVIGSNIFNILGVLGISSLISPLSITLVWQFLIFGSYYLQPYYYLIMLRKKKAITFFNGITFLFFIYYI